MFVRANNKAELIDDIRLELKNRYNSNVPTALIKRIISTRDRTIRNGIENNVERVIIPTIGSFKIKKGKKQKNGIKLDRKFYVNNIHCEGGPKYSKEHLASRFKGKFKVVSHGEEES